MFPNFTPTLLLLLLLPTYYAAIPTYTCGTDGYTVTNYKNRGYLKLYKKVYQPFKPDRIISDNGTEADMSSNDDGHEMPLNDGYEMDCFKCWKSSVVYSVPYDEEKLTEYSDLCADDPKFFQVQ